MLKVNGRAAKVFGLTGPDGRPGIRLAGEGELGPFQPAALGLEQKFPAIDHGVCS